MTLSEKITGKNILFFSVKFFGIESSIKQALSKAGAQVFYFDERPSNSKVTKGLIRVRRSLLKKQIDNYYNQILDQIKGIPFQFLFVNHGEVIPEEFLQRFKAENPNCECLLYTWDSMANEPHPLKILNYFDFVFSFDNQDCKKYQLILQPLFFRTPFKKIKAENTKSFEYDLLFLGTAHSDRYEISNKIVEWGNQNGLSSFCYYYMQGKWIYWYKRIFDPTFKKFDYKKLSFKGLKQNRVIDLYRRSRVFLDINHPKQIGLTMRTIEAIGCGRKLITTNKEIVRYPFYNPKNMLLIDRDNPTPNLEFFHTDYDTGLSEDVYERLSLDGFLTALFVKQDLNYWGDFVIGKDQK